MAPNPLGKFRPRTSESRRIELEREISFRLPRFENFITEYSANISATGIFICTDKPLEPGTDFTFEFKVADDWELIRGRGRVIWVRSKDGGSPAPAGMGVRFLEMDPQSRRLIHWMVDNHAREGGDTFEFEELRQTADQALAEAFGGAETLIVAGRGSGQSVAASRAAFARRLVLVVVALTLLGLLSWLVLHLTPPGTTEGTAAEPATTQLAVEAATEAPIDGDSSDTTPAVVTETSSPTRAANDLLDAWADAWSEGRVEDYLSCYSTDFTPGNGLTLAEWRASRAERLSSPQHIRVSITALEFEVLSADRLRATFFQNYRSDRFEDTVRKRLELGLAAGSWRILEERVVG